MSYDEKTRWILELPKVPDPNFLETRDELGEFVARLGELEDAVGSFCRTFHGGPDWDEDYKVEQHQFNRHTLVQALEKVSELSMLLEEIKKGSQT